MADAVTRSLHVSWSQMFCSLDPARKVPSHPQSLSRKLPKSWPSRTHSIPRTMPFSTKPFALSRALWCTRSRWLWHMSSWLMAHVPCRSDVPCPASQTADVQKDNGNNGEQGSSADGDESSDRSDTTPWSPDHSPPDPQVRATVGPSVPLSGGRTGPGLPAAPLPDPLSVRHSPSIGISSFCSAPSVLPSVHPSVRFVCFCIRSFLFGRPVWWSVARSARPSGRPATYPSECTRVWINV